jgi:hypothetical protein
MLNIKIIFILLIIIIIILIKKKCIENMTQNNYLKKKIFIVNNNIVKFIEGSDDNNCIQNVKEEIAIDICNKNNDCNIFYKDEDKFCFLNSYSKTEYNESSKFYNLYIKKDYDEKMGMIANKCSLNYKEIISYFKLIKKNLKEKYKKKKINFMEYYNTVNDLINTEMIKKQYNINDDNTIDIHDCILKNFYSYKKNDLNIINNYNNIENEIKIKDIISIINNESQKKNFIMIYRFINNNTELSDSEIIKLSKSQDQHILLDNKLRELYDIYNNSLK